MAQQNTYIGDGVYVARDEGGIVLTTENGLRATNTIYLEWEVFELLALWVKEVAETE
jgi:hypothetical protein